MSKKVEITAPGSYTNLKVTVVLTSGETLNGTAVYVGPNHLILTVVEGQGISAKTKYYLLSWYSVKYVLYQQ